MSRLSKTFMPPNSVNGCWLPTLISPICTSLSVTEFPLINEFYRINKWVAARLTGLFVVQGRLNITGEQRVAVSRCRGKFRVDRKSTRLNSSHVGISYAVFCLRKKHTAEAYQHKQ